MKTQPWYSIHASDAALYHDSDSCSVANRIALDHRYPGIGNRLRCSECARLERKEREIRGQKAFDQEYYRVRVYGGNGR